MNKISTTNTMATIGKTMEMIDISIEVPVSTVDTTGLANPPVEAVEANLAAPEDPEMAAAVPPPAIMANDQVITGSISTKVDTITTVPAKVANGMATLSNKLSIYGM